ncbi:MAG: DUF2071 domain-containing protein [Pirellulales bacterium]|nr:DUF2071 domain-containing protein [Pirellulales bacterium]
MTYAAAVPQTTNDRATNQRPFLTARWQWLLMLNFEAPVEALTAWAPRGTEIDTWEGRTYVSLVAFRFLDTIVRGLPIPFHRHFDEVNLRFYVRRQGPEGWRRGVVFVKEIVPRWAIAAVARLIYNENYVARPMGHELALRDGLPKPGSTVAYNWRQGSRVSRLAAVVAGGPAPLLPGSQAEFIAEHYWGYARQRDGGTMEYRVEHPPWRVLPIEQPRCEIDAADEYGQPFAAWLERPPVSAFLAEGSPVVVRRGVRLI